MNWSDLGFRIEITGDGSPSLRLIQSLNEVFTDGEAMHHSGGACAETDLIYGACIRQTFAQLEKPHFMVVGLGLGYIEMFIARESLLLQRKPGSILSFESIPGLREGFYGWISRSPLSEEMQKTYDQVCENVVRGTDLKILEIQNFLKEYFPQVSSIQGALDSNVQYVEKYHAILYDAFSSKTSPHLWEEDFLQDFLARAAAPSCHLSTYACKGNLKRALRAQGFILNMQDGFQGKRNRISASRIF